MPFEFPYAYLVVCHLHLKDFDLAADCYKKGMRQLEVHYSGTHLFEASHFFCYQIRTRNMSLAIRHFEEWPNISAGTTNEENNAIFRVVSLSLFELLSSE